MKSSLHPRTESRKRKGGRGKGTALPQEPQTPLPRWAQEPGWPGPERFCWAPGPEDAGLFPDPRARRPVQGASAHTPGSPASLGSPARPSLSSACQSVCFSPWSFSFVCALHLSACRRVQSPGLLVETPRTVQPGSWWGRRAAMATGRWGTRQPLTSWVIRFRGRAGGCAAATGPGSRVSPWGSSRVSAIS